MSGDWFCSFEFIGFGRVVLKIKVVEFYEIETCNEIATLFNNFIEGIQVGQNYFAFSSKAVLDAFRKVYISFGLKKLLQFFFSVNSS